MGIVFAVRGNSLDARYSNGGKTGVSMGAGFAVTADATVLGGSVLLAPSNNNLKSVIWNGRYNTPNGRTISIMQRTKFAHSGNPSASRPLLPALGTNGGRLGRINVDQLTNGTVQIAATNELGTTAISNLSPGSISPTSGNEHDCVLTWDGTTNSNACKFYFDGVLIGTGVTPGAAMSSSWANTWWQEIALGGSIVATTHNGSGIVEIVIWDEIIDPTSVLLESGTGSLNGESRSSFVAVDSFDGQSYTDPGLANVKTGIGYTYAGISSTGTYIASERYSDPGIANVLSGTSYLFNAATLTGTYNVPTYTDPGIANVRSGTAYIYNNSTLTGTLTAPGGGSGVAGTVDLNNIKETIQYVLEQANTTTATPVDLSANMSRRVQNVSKVNPDMIPLQASLFPFVTCYIESKSIKDAQICKDQLNVKRRATVTVKIVGGVFNHNVTSNDTDPADEDINYLMENIELTLRSSHDLGGNVKWQKTAEVKYFSSPTYDQDTNIRTGLLTLDAEVFY